MVGSGFYPPLFQQCLLHRRDLINIFGNNEWKCRHIQHICIMKTFPWANLSFIPHKKWPKPSSLRQISQIPSQVCHPNRDMKYQIPTFISSLQACKHTHVFSPNFYQTEAKTELEQSEFCNPPSIPAHFIKILISLHTCVCELTHGERDGAEISISVSFCFLSRFSNFANFIQE